jgi:hypothetical protein
MKRISPCLLIRFFLHRQCFIYFLAGTAVSASERCTSVTIFAVHLSIAETLQYFSSDSLTASSTALRETCPETV